MELNDTYLNKYYKIFVDAMARVIKKFLKGGKLNEYNFEFITKTPPKHDITVGVHIMNKINCTILYCYDFTTIDNIITLMKISNMPMKKEKKQILTAIEFSNMIAGHAAGIFEDMYDMEIMFTNPVIIDKNEIEYDDKYLNQSIKIPFKCSFGDIITYIMIIE